MAALTDIDQNSASEAVPTQRIPAWKRLGFKLKFANEHTDQPPQLDSKTSTDKKRSYAQESQTRPEETHSDHDRKKRLRLNPPNTPSPKTNAGILSPSVKRDSNGIKKSVSFTSDTKVEDGDSSKTLIADWEAQYDQPSISVNTPKDPELSKTKKSSESKKSKPTSTTDKPHSALEYLTQFHQSRGSWKFSKNKEIWILKHLFSVDDIPSDYDIALCRYLQNLKSVSGRSRIRQAAEEIVQKDREQPVEILSSDDNDDTAQIRESRANMEDPEQRRAYYEDSVRRYKRKLEQHLDKVAEEELNWVSPERLAKRRRAEITLWATGVTPSSEETTPSSESTISRRSSSRAESSTTENGVQTNNTKKKRKNRTSVIEVSSSSSEDESGDSSSDSSSDEAGSEENDQPEVGLNTRTTIQASSPNTLSSSSESSTVSEDSESRSSSSEESDDKPTDSPRNGLAGKRRSRQRSVISISS